MRPSNAEGTALGERELPRANARSYGAPPLRWCSLPMPLRLGGQRPCKVPVRNAQGACLPAFRTSEIDLAILALLESCAIHLDATVKAATAIWAYKDKRAHNCEPLSQPRDKIVFILSVSIARTATRVSRPTDRERGRRRRGLSAPARYRLSRRRQTGCAAGAWQGR